MKKVYTIKSDYAEARLDRWFRRNISRVPQSLIEKNLRKGNIKVNNKKEKSSYKLRKNDQIVIYNIELSHLALEFHFDIECFILKTFTLS